MKEIEFQSRIEQEHKNPNPRLVKPYPAEPRIEITRGRGDLPLSRPPSLAGVWRRTGRRRSLSRILARGRSRKQNQRAARRESPAAAALPGLEQKRREEKNAVGFPGNPALCRFLIRRDRRPTVGFDPTVRGGRPANRPETAHEGAARGPDSWPRPRLWPGRGRGGCATAGRWPNFGFWAEFRCRPRRKLRTSFSLLFQKQFLNMTFRRFCLEFKSL